MNINNFEGIDLQEVILSSKQHKIQEEKLKKIEKALFLAIEKIVDIEKRRDCRNLFEKYIEECAGVIGSCVVSSCDIGKEVGFILGKKDLF